MRAPSSLYDHSATLTVATVKVSERTYWDLNEIAGKPSARY